jgi:hypothetical protein
MNVFHVCYILIKYPILSLWTEKCDMLVNSSISLVIPTMELQNNHVGLIYFQFTNGNRKKDLGLHKSRELNLVDKNIV